MSDYFDQIVSALNTGDRAYYVGMGSEQYRFMKALRLSVPEAFEKRGLVYYFIGDAGKLIDNKTSVIEKMTAIGFKFKKDVVQKSGGPVVTSKQQKRIELAESMSDEELFARIQDTFDSLTLLSEASAEMKIRSMIVSGSPGTGKTFEVIKAMKAKAKTSRDFYYHQVKGTISPIALYIELYRARNGVLILDDADEAFTDPESLQLLKAATESSKDRNVSYRKLSMALEAEGIPQEFTFSGCVVILTNTNLEDTRKQRQSHYDAIMSRAHFINAVLETDREKIMRIRHIVTTTKILHDFLDPSRHQMVVDFVEEHHTRFRELSIRTVVKLAELCSAFPTKWETLARGTLLV